MRISRGLLTLGIALAVGAGCDDPFSPDYEPVSGTGVVYSLAREANVGLPSAFDMTPFPPPRPIVVEDPGSTADWDIALSEEDGEFVLLPSGVLPGQSNAAIARITDRGFEQVDEAPEGSDAFVTDEAVPLRQDAAYVIRSRRRGTCVYYSKIRALEIDAERGRARIEYLLNQSCNQRRLVGDEDD